MSRKPNIVWQMEENEKAKKETVTRAKLMRKVHAYAKYQLGLDDPHPLLHQLSVAEFAVESMSSLTIVQLQELYRKLQAQSIDWKKVENLGITRVPEMSANQQTLVKKLQRELGWSDEMLIKVAINRYGYLHYKYLTGREAWAFCNYLIRRSREKRFNKSEAKTKAEA